MVKTRASQPTSRRKTPRAYTICLCMITTEHHRLVTKA